MSGKENEVKKHARPGPRPARPPRKDWTILVFMVGDVDLRPSIARDVLELQRAGSSDRVNVVVSVQPTRRSDSEWLEIQPLENGRPPKAKTIGRSSAAELDDRLNAFLEKAGKDYPAERFLLVMWGHASGFGFGHFSPGAQEDLIRLSELSTCLTSLQSTRPGRPKLDILGFCACAVSKAEYAIELREHVDFLVSSQVGISTLMTWPFDAIVNRVLMSPEIPADTLACEIVQSFEQAYEPPPVALTALDLKESKSLEGRVNTIAGAIVQAFGASGIAGRLNSLSVLSAFRRSIAAYPYEVEPLVDFFDFCDKLITEEALQDSVRAKARSVLNQGPQRFVINNARSGPKFAALNGLAILAPDFDDPNFGVRCDRCAAGAAGSTWLWQQTKWVEMVRMVHAFAAAEPELSE